MSKPTWDSMSPLTPEIVFTDEFCRYIKKAPFSFIWSCQVVYPLPLWSMAESMERCLKIVFLIVSDLGANFTIGNPCYSSKMSSQITTNPPVACRGNLAVIHCNNFATDLQNIHTLFRHLEQSLVQYYQRALKRTQNFAEEYRSHEYTSRSDTQHPGLHPLRNGISLFQGWYPQTHTHMVDIKNMAWGMSTSKSPLSCNCQSGPWHLAWSIAFGIISSNENDMVIHGRFIHGITAKGFFH